MREYQKYPLDAERIASLGRGESFATDLVGRGYA